MRGTTIEVEYARPPTLPRFTAEATTVSRMIGFRTALLLSFVWAAPDFAHALTLSAEPGADCFSTDPANCIGGVYTLDVAAVDEDTWLATFTMDLGLGLEIPATTIEQIEFKVANDYGASVSVLSGPGGAGNWSVVAGPLAAGGCKGSNDSFVCIDAISPVAVSPSIYTWQVQFDAKSLLAESDWHIGARYASPDHEKGWILSASSSPIPEPRSTALYLLGGVIVAVVLRKQLLTAR